MFFRHNSRGAVNRRSVPLRTANKRVNNGASNRLAIRLLVATPVLCGLFLIIFGLKSIFIAEKPLPLISLEVSSDPPGATISLNGKKMNITTPGRLLLPEGFNKVVLQKKDYASYTIELEVKKDLTVLSSTVPSFEQSVSPNVSPAISPANKEPTGSLSSKQNRGLPDYFIKAKLSLAVANLIQLSPGLPNLQILKARYLSAVPNLVEISEQVEGSGSIVAGAEGISSGLWIYDSVTRQSRPVLIANQALDLMLKFYGLEGDTTGKISNALNRLILTAPVLSSDGRNLAVISRLLPDKNSEFPTAYTLNNAASASSEDWNTQAIWKLPVSTQISTSGAWLAGSEAPGSKDLNNDQTNQQSGEAVKIASLADLLTVLPGLKAVSDNNPKNTRLTTEFPSFQEISWNLEDNKLLLVTKLPQVNDPASSNGNTALILVDLEQGDLKLATPLPLPVTVLPGTVKWSRGSKAVSFLVQENNQTVGLCVLDLEQTLQSEPGKESYSTSQTTENPFHYLGKLGGNGIWAGTSSITNPSNGGGGASFPPSFGSVRYNTFTWANLDEQPHDLLIGAYGKAAPAWATGAGQAFDTLYAYLPYKQNRNQTAGDLEPLTLDQKQLAASSQDSDSLPEDSYPFWSTDLYGLPHLFYLSSRMAQSSGGFLGGNNYLEISLNELNLQNTPFESVLQKTVKILPGNEIKNTANPSNSAGQSGIRVTLLRAYSDPVKLPAFEDNGSRDFEADFKPDGTGAIIALPGARNGRNVQFWLVTWN